MSSNRKANAALAAAAIFLLLSSGAAYMAFGRLHTSEDWVHHTREVEKALSEYTLTIARAGRLRAEYVDSGDLSLLQQQADVVRDLRNTMESVRHLTSDNLSQVANVAKLQKLTEQRISLMDESITLKKAGESSLAAQAAITRRVVATAAATDQLLQNMYDIEDQLLGERQARVHRSTFLLVAILLASLLSALTLFLVHHRLLTDQVEARTRAELSQRTLSARLLGLQDEERRRFARELHDSVGQHLAALKMSMSTLRTRLPGDDVIKDCLKLLDHSIAETRTISHLLHPPLLDEAGLNSASRWFVEGFGKRSGIDTKLDIRDGSGRLPQPVELVLFRALQESLTNVHRHSGATKAEVSLNVVGHDVVLRVKDDGKGMPAHVLQSFRESGPTAGVGLAGMKERIQEIGGRLEINSGRSGTEIVASVSLPRTTPELSPPAAQEQEVGG